MATEMKSVFIAYAHNPDEYQYLEPPETDDPQILEHFERDWQRNQQQQDNNIRQQKKLVYEFANFLSRNHVKVSYDQLLDDKGCDNKMKWYQEQMEESDYVIIITTPSLRAFLNEAPEEEMLFTGHYFDNFIQLNSSKILSVFLGQDKNRELLPMGLYSGNVYSIAKPFTLEASRPSDDDTERLYALLSGQDRFVLPAPPTERVQIRPKGRLNRGPAGSAVGQHRNWQSVFERLSRIKTPLTDEQITLIAGKSKFNTRWEDLASLLELTSAQIEVCRVDSRGYGEGEKCYHMLRAWRNSGLQGRPDKISVARLTYLVQHSLRNMEMLEVLDECVK